MDYPLLNIGDIVEDTSGPFSQVEQLTSWNVIYSGGITTAHVTAEFATSSDGTAYSTYQVINDTNLQAVSLDADNPLYIKTRFTRIGGTGTGEVLNWTYFVEIDPDAVSGHGKITNLSITSDLIELIPKLVDDYNYQVSGGNHYKIKHGVRTICQDNPEYPLVYFGNIIRGEQRQVGFCEYEQDVEFRIGVKADPCHNGHKGLFTMYDRLQEMFSTNNVQNFPYTITFKNIPLVANKLSDMGIFSVNTTRAQQFSNENGEVTGYEFGVSFYLTFKQHREFDSYTLN